MTIFDLFDHLARGTAETGGFHELPSDEDEIAALVEKDGEA